MAGPARRFVGTALGTESQFYRSVAKDRRASRRRPGLRSPARGCIATSSRPTYCSTSPVDVWVTDFGLAKIEGSEGPTRTGDIVGTVRYMPPERFDGWSDRRSDVYSLGATLYELLTLHPLFVRHAAGRADREGAPRVTGGTRASSIAKIPRDLETIVLRPSPRSRPPLRHGAGARRRSRTVPGGSADCARSEHDGRAMLAPVPAKSRAGKGQYHRGRPDHGARHRLNHRSLDLPRSAQHDQPCLVQVRQSEAQERLRESRLRETLFESLWTRLEPDGTADGRDNGSIA